jgi:tRNA threonylcarbamoyladenosine biosynthesis protein TsaB
MNLLAIETASDSCSVALERSGERFVEHVVAARQHTQIVMDMVATVLEAGGLDIRELTAIAFGRGPGSFTGVRIATAVTQGLAFGINVPVLPISTLATLAQGAMRRGHVNRVLVAIDARRDEVYFGAFEADEQGIASASGQETVGPLREVNLPQGDWALAGEGWRVYGDAAVGLLADRGISGDSDESYPHASHTLTLAMRAFANADAVPAAQAVPVYLRDQVTR